MSLKTLIKLVRSVPAVFQAAAAKHYAVESLRRRLQQRPLLAIVASGNSCYPARYLEWLARASGQWAQVLSPLEYALLPPSQPHVCLLVSQGASRGDSRDVQVLAEKQQTALFVLCGEHALTGPSVATDLAATVGAEHVFAVPCPAERGFVSIAGTAAAMAGAWAVVQSLMSDSRPFCPPVQDGLFEDLENLEWVSAHSPVVLFGPAGRPAAEAFSGYHCESLGPCLAYDMKNFTHGVWRGLREAGRHAVYLVVEPQVAALARFLQAKLCGDHNVIVLTAPTHAIPPWSRWLSSFKHCVRGRSFANSWPTSVPVGRRL